MAKNNGEIKRLIWARLIIWVVLIVCGATAGYTMNVDSKLAETEKKRAASASANSVRFETILVTLAEIKEELREMRKEKP